MGRQLTNPAAVTVQGTVNTLQSQGGRVPATPSITGPTSNTNLSTWTPEITSSAFFVYNSDTHSGSNWQIATDPNFTNIVRDLASTSQRVSWTLGASDLPRQEGPVYVRVRYISSASEVTPFSSPIILNRVRTISVVPGVQDANTYSFAVSYTGTGMPTSMQVRVSANLNMSSPIVDGTFSVSGGVASFAAAMTSLPGYATGSTAYYISVTPIGADSIATEYKATLTSPSNAFTASNQEAYYLDNTQGVVWGFTLNGGNAQKAIQFSTTQDFSSVVFSSTTSPVAASNLPGLADGTTTYYYRVAAKFGNEFSALSQGATMRTVAILSSLTSGASSGTYSIPARLAGTATIHYIGGGGGGPTNMNGGSGGGGSGQIRVWSGPLAGGDQLIWSAGSGAPRVEVGEAAQTPAPSGSATTLTVAGVVLPSATGGGGGSGTSGYGGTDFGTAGAGGANGCANNSTGSGGSTWATGLHAAYGPEGSGSYYNGAGGPGYKHTFGLTDPIRGNTIGGDEGPKWPSSTSPTATYPGRGGAGGIGFGGGGGGGDHYSYYSWSARGERGAVIVWFGGYPF